ncbi:DNA-processing protein DprA [Pseudomonas sp. MF6747]|uniref:DNA-processing protein DprA n=1 Tax=Pseudomonas sp. MF6747 TaxID=2797527 RepID=UPI001F2B8E15|nr:DNA-processing protein DprA [Pseudomonas sp. MF6747]
MKVSVATKKLLALSMLAGIGPAALKKVASVPNFEFLSVDEIANVCVPLRKVLASSEAWELAYEQADAQVSLASKYESKIISALDDDYPHLLAATKDDPFIIYVRGELYACPLRSVAIIGTREPTPHGEVITRRVTEYFVENQWSVVSGLALGCDGLAHKAALDSGGHTVAVLAHGLQMIAPSQHRKLAEDILEGGGALISEYPFGRKVFSQQYVKRDRTQAGMAQGVVMIQSDVKGGSLHASRAALDYERWLAIPLPTSIDRNNKESKIMANLLIAEGEWVDKANLLKCKREHLNNIIVLRTKNDYPSMLLQPLLGSLETSSNKTVTPPVEVGHGAQTKDSEILDIDNVAPSGRDDKSSEEDKADEQSNKPLTHQNSLL